MAEIPIERKEGRSIWPWIIGLIIVAALIWYFVSRRNGTVATPGRTDSAMITPHSGTLSTGTLSAAMRQEVSTYA